MVPVVRYGVAAESPMPSEDRNDREQGNGHRSEEKRKPTGRVGASRHGKYEYHAWIERLKEVCLARSLSCEDNEPRAE